MTGKLTVGDCMCPICMSILIEPVTMPCTHTLCMPCFKQNVEETSLTCPICRTRISVWARRAAKSGTLVNTKLWSDIRSKFGDKVDKRLTGEDDEDEDEVNFPVIQIANPGEIRREYEAEVEKLAVQRQKEQREEREASEALIRKLQDEEMSMMEHRRREMHKITEEDGKLAKELTDVIHEAGTEVPMRFLMEESRTRLTRSTSATSASSVSGSTSQSSNRPETIESFLSRLQKADKLKKADRASSSSSVIYFPDTPDPQAKFFGQSEKFLQEGKFKDSDSASSGSSLPYLCDVSDDKSKLCIEREQDVSSTSTSDESKSREGSSWNYDLHTENGGIFSEQLSREFSKSPSSCTVDPVVVCRDMESKARAVIISPDVEIITDKLQQELLRKQTPSPSSADRASRISKLSRASSLESDDSITQELNHFKPINVCPVTPPRKLASGKIIEPPLIRTTPRNLNKSSFSSPSNDLSLSDIDACSPIMQRRLSELEEERKINVRRLSKSTLTVKTDEDGSNENNSAVPGCSIDKNNSANLDQSRKLYSRKAVELHNTDVTILYDDGRPKRKLMIPLESNIDDSLDFDIPPPLSENNNINNVDSDSRSSSGTSKLRKKPNKTGRRKLNSACSQKSSSDKQRRDSFSPQRSITDWVIKGGNSRRKSPASLLAETIQATSSGRDEVDGDFSSTHTRQVKLSHKPIDEFMTKVPKEPLAEITGDRDSRTVRSRRVCRKKQNDDYMWPDLSPKKRNQNLSSICLHATAISASSSQQPRHQKGPFLKMRFLSNKESERTNFKKRKVSEVAKRNLTKELKSLKKSKSSTIVFKNQSPSSQEADGMDDSVCYSDLSNKVFSDPPSCELSVDANLNIIPLDSDNYSIINTREKQEEMDKLLALKLSKEFELEAKFSLGAIRFKGSDNEYKLRQHRRSKVLD